MCLGCAAASSPRAMCDNLDRATDPGTKSSLDGAGTASKMAALAWAVARRGRESARALSGCRHPRRQVRECRVGRGDGVESGALEAVSAERVFE